MLWTRQTPGVQEGQSSALQQYATAQVELAVAHVASMPQRHSQRRHHQNELKLMADLFTASRFASGTLSLVRDWTFGSSPHPRKCSLTRLQDFRRPRPSVTKDIAFVRPKVTNGCSEAQVRRPGPSGTRIAFGAPRRKRKPSPGAGVCVKREYVRRSVLYT